MPPKEQRKSLSITGRLSPQTRTAWKSSARTLPPGSAKIVVDATTDDPAIFAVLNGLDLGNANVAVKAQVTIWLDEPKQEPDPGPIDTKSGIVTRP